MKKSEGERYNEMKNPDEQGSGSMSYSVKKKKERGSDKRSLEKRTGDRERGEKRGSNLRYQNPFVAFRGGSCYSAKGGKKGPVSRT